MRPTENRLREAVERYGPAVVRHCRGFTPDVHLADDLAQEVFARLCEILAKPDRKREDLPWKLVQGVMRNVFLEYLRRKKKAPLLESKLEVVSGEDDCTSHSMQLDDNKARLRVLVERLGIREQQAIIGRHFLGMSIADLTQFLGLPRSTVVDYYNRGLNRLREMAKDHGLFP